MKIINPVIVIHGGAGVIKQNTISEEQVKSYYDALDNILYRAQALLKEGKNALDVVTHAVKDLEDCPLFNAGHGAVFTHEKTHELDAAIMDGATLNAGAIAGVSTIKHPIEAARAVMENSPHVMFIGSGAEKFAKEQGLELVEPSYFSTPFRLAQLENAIATNAGVIMDHNGDTKSLDMPITGPIDEKNKFGTVGAVAIDVNGNLAAATSTGGMTNKQIGRVGDSPILGAGTYANNETVAISCTGTGEAFMRAVTAYDVHAHMAYKGLSLEQATHEVVINKLTQLGGEGGLIAVDKDGNISMCFNSEGMYRGYAYANGEVKSLIFK